MAAVNPCDFVVARQTLFERCATNFLGSSTIKIGSNYWKSCKHLPENLFWVVRINKRPIFVVAGESVPESYSVKKRYTLIRYKY